MTEDTGVKPDSAEAARAEIERTRARMSETIDAIEDSIIRKREDLRRRFDLVARIREKPLEAAGLVLAAGLVIGLLTGGRKTAPPALPAPAKDDRWEARSRRLLDIARRQEEEIDELEAMLDDAEDRAALLARTYEAALDDDAEEWEDEVADDDEMEDDGGFPGASGLSDLKAAIAERVEDYAATAVATLLDALKRRR